MNNYNCLDLNIIKDGPFVRRKFLDMELCQIDKLYLNELSNYNKILNQRNILLKNIYYADKNNKNDLINMLDIYDEQIIKSGIKIIEKRKENIEEIKKYISDIYFKISDKKEKLVIKYETEIEKETQKKTKCVVLDVPIPVRKFVDLCNQIWIVTCDEQVKLSRLVDRGMKLDEAKRRIAVQMTDDEYSELGDFVIDNSGSLEELNEKVDNLVIKQLHERGIRI